LRCSRRLIARGNFLLNAAMGVLSVIISLMNLSPKLFVKGDEFVYLFELFGLAGGRMVCKPSI
jgi:hypothetical protein